MKRYFHVPVEEDQTSLRVAFYRGDPAELLRELERLLRTESGLITIITFRGKTSVEFAGSEHSLVCSAPSLRTALALLAAQVREDFGRLKEDPAK